jgi:catechol 2,3-dioxygenase-like lactoylglutathione lyase family enzyme
MRVSFVAGFGPVTRDPAASRTFWRDDLGIAMEEIAPDYQGTDDLDGVNAFAAWPLAQAAESCFGTDAWPAEVPAPQAWIELDVEDEASVAEAAAELAARGHRLLRQAGTEPWGQTVARLLSPEGLLVGITFTPWMHGNGDDDVDDEDVARG